MRLFFRPSRLSEDRRALNPTSPPLALRIFIVENHSDTLKILTRYLEELGHTVFPSHSVEEALAAWPGAGCHVLISDIGLPDGTGWDLLRRLQSPKPIYAIAMSGFGMNADRVKSGAAGFRQHILKPFDPDDLESMLEEAAQELPK